MGHEYGIFQGEWTYAWDGVAVINRGTETATLTITQETMAGKVLSKARIDQTVGPNARGLIVFGDHFQEMPGESVILKIHSDQPVSATFLRGTQPGIQPALLFVTSPLFVL
jgi:hypothetical protein